MSVAWLGANRLERRHLSPVDWTGLECRIGEGLPAGPLPASHEVVRALLEPNQRSGQIVQYVSVQDVTAAPGKVAETLDAWLRRLASVKPTPR